ncbi:MAG: glycosyltransferase [Bacteroides sp.]|nr:glycosyltransferase [Bacteroides sp.]
MKLQEIIFPQDNIDETMFYRGDTMLKSGEALSFDTYFNSFSYTKYRDYTRVGSVSFLCSFSGIAEIALCVFDGEERTVRKAQAENSAEISVDFSELPEKGFLYPKITAISDCEFIGGKYSAEYEPNKINVCAAICTYKREQYVLKNIELLRNYKFSFINRVFVVDNGKTLEPSLSDSFIEVLPNKNYGGSGGFTRGLIEAYDNSFSHIILMDDDVEFFPQTLEQITVFISLLTERFSKSWFGTGMFPLDKPWEQFELGAQWNGELTSHKHRIDLRQQKNLLDNLDNPNLDYSAWWTLCMPISVTENGLPFPFFIKGDDIEYGLRKNHGTEIITMNAIGVRHEAFDRKTSFVLYYYNVRNELAINAVHKKYGTFKALKRFWFEILKQLILYRYDNCKIVFMAVRDFLRGVDFFLETDEEQLNNRLSQLVPQLVPLSELPEWNETMRSDEHARRNKITAAMVLTLGGHIIPAFALKKEIKAYPLSRIGTEDTFLRKSAVQYQLGGDKGILTRRSFAKFVKYGFRALGQSFVLLFKYRSVQKNYICRSAEITSFEFWRKHLSQ